MLTGISDSLGRLVNLISISHKKCNPVPPRLAAGWCPGRLWYSSPRRPGYLGQVRPPRLWAEQPH